MKSILSKRSIPLYFVLVLLLSAMLRAQFVTLVTANPIPVPSIEMPYEYIDAAISLDKEVMTAKVNGTYTFRNIYYDNVTMYYPVPPDAEKISVMNDTSLLDWSYSNRNYSTVINDFPMINWTIKLVSGYFNITTYYEHHVPLINGSYMFLYAMGTGRFLADYFKQTTAYVTIRIGMDIAHPDTLNLYTIENSSGTWIWKPANYTITPENGTWKITSTFQSEFFHPLEEDLLLTFSPLEAQLNLSSLNTVHLYVNGTFTSSSSLIIMFHGYSGIYQANTTVWNSTTSDHVLLSENVSHPLGWPVENVTLILTDDTGIIIQKIITFVVHRSHLMERLVKLDMDWLYAPEERSTIFMEIVDIDAQWPYAPP